MSAQQIYCPLACFPSLPSGILLAGDKQNCDLGSAHLNQLTCFKA